MKIFPLFRLLVVRPSPTFLHFKDVCLFGADFCMLYGVRATIDYRLKEVVLVSQELGDEG